jgi:hypothetical protein
MINSMNISDNTFHTLQSIKEKEGFKNKTWDEWFYSKFSDYFENKSTENVIETILSESAFNTYYDEWIGNFSINLNSIWEEKSVRDLVPNSLPESPALIIGRGPSIKKKNHFKILAESDFKGSILCSDGNLINALNSDITPEKFENFYVVTIDSQERQKKFYSDPIVKKFGDKIKCILSTTASPETHKAIIDSGLEVYWVHTLVDYNKGKNSFNYIANTMTKTKNHSKGLPAIQTGGNVGTTSWILSWSVLKHKTVGLIGIDHGFYSDDRTIDDHKLPDGIDKNSSAFKQAYPTIYNPEFDCYCIQDPIFQYYSNSLKEFIKKTSDKVNTINATEGGAIFGEGITCSYLSDFLKTYNY